MKIVPVTLFALSSFLYSTRSLAQTALPYTSGFDNTAEKSGWQSFRKGVSGSSEWNYNTALPYSPAERLSHLYPVGGTAVTDDWFVSPMFHFPSGGTIDSVRHLFSGFGTPTAGDTVAIYLLVGNSDPALASDQVLLYDYRDSKYNNDAAWHQTTSVPIPPASGHCYVAFRYHTTVNWLDVSFDNLGISSTGTGIKEQPKKERALVFFPNPSTDQIHFKSDAIKEIAITDISGKVVLQQPYASTVNIGHLAPGMYQINAALNSGIVVSQKLIKK